MKNNLKVLSFTSLMLLCELTHAMGGVFNSGRGFYTLGLGPVWAQEHSSQTILIQSDIVKTYDANSLSSPAFGGELFFGIANDINNNCLSQVGIALAGVSSLKMKGDIWEDGNPNFNNFNYEYDINHIRLALKAKFLTAIRPEWFGYISGSVGGGVNSTSNFTITPKIFEAVPAPPFANNSTIAFAYSLGLGIQAQVYGNWQLGFGYEFADLGKSELGRATGQTLNTGIQLNNLYTHQLLISLTYLCDAASKADNGSYGNIWY